ncbi:MAG: glycerol-3-phosphate 1-O-acyltransferase PlsY [bacterium]
MIGYEYVLLVVAAYLIGAIPFGLLYSLYIGREDIRKKGSGNIGATNVLRNFGWLPGLITLFLDISKGALPVLGALYFIDSPAYLPVITGVAAIFGHVYPVYLKFSGGKGVATSAGVFMVLAPVPLLVAVAVFLLMVVITRYVSAGSISAAVALPVGCGLYGGLFEPVSFAALILGLVVVWRHRSNIKKLWHGEEDQFY